MTSSAIKLFIPRFVATGFWVIGARRETIIGNTRVSLGIKGRDHLQMGSFNDLCFKFIGFLPRLLPFTKLSPKYTQSPSHSFLIL